MSRGDKDYFRHSFFAHEDEKLVSLYDKLGKASYFYYFNLLELAGRNTTSIGQMTYCFHLVTLKEAWRTTPTMVRRVCKALNDTMLVRCEDDGNNMVRLTLANFPKYLGRYASGEALIKEKKRKEKKSTYKEKKYTRSVDAPSSEDATSPLEDDCNSGLPMFDAVALSEMLTEMSGRWLVTTKDINQKLKKNPVLKKKVQVALKEYPEKSQWEIIFKEINHMFKTEDFWGGRVKLHGLGWLFQRRKDGELNYVGLYETGHQVQAEIDKADQVLRDICGIE